MPANRGKATRVARLEKIGVETGERVKIPLDSQIRTDARIAQIHEQMRKLNERTDKRIGDLVNAIGKLIERLPPAAGTHA